jgi:hypothetical protein
MALRAIVTRYELDKLDGLSRNAGSSCTTHPN